jgi:integrase
MIENAPQYPENSPPDAPLHGAGDRVPSEPLEPARATGATRAEGSAFPVSLDRLAERARSYAEASSSANTRRAYASDLRHFASWCRRQGLDAFTPDPQVVGLYIAGCASGQLGDVGGTGLTAAARAPSGAGDKVSTIERRLSALVWAFAQRGTPLDRRDRHIATVLAGVRNTHAAPPEQKEAIPPEDLIAMLETVGRDLRGLRDRAMLLVGFAGGLRRSEITGLDFGRDQSEDGRGWVEFMDKGLLVTLRGKTGWREVEIGRGSSDATCPIAALRSWLRFAKIHHGPLFRRVSGKAQVIGLDRLNDREVARLVKRAAMAAGLRPDLAEGKRAFAFAGHSLRAGLASSVEVEERYVQKQLGHASAEMTRRYQRRRDRFRVNLTKAVGL